MESMFVTLEVSKLSGRLNADANCRKESRKEGMRCVWGEVCGRQREAAGDRGARSLQERARLQIGGRGHGEERTQNMESMFVTLEVSKLSGWLNTDATCRGSKGGHIRCAA